jgi:diacylglycerol kinase (ATP)
MADGLRGFTRLWRATRVSYWGLGYALRGEEAFRIEFCLFIVMAPLALWLGPTGLHKAILLLSLLIVLITELLNTGIEVTVDRIGKEHHELSGRAKDVGSAAVHISLLQVPVIWGLVLFG